MAESKRRPLHGKLWRYGRKRFLAACVKHPSLRKVRFARWKRMQKNYDALAAKTPVSS